MPRKPPRKRRKTPPSRGSGAAGGGVGIGKSIHAGVVVVADGSAPAYEKVTRVLTNDPGTGVLRHADAGYEIAERAAREVGIRIPMLDGTHAPPWQPPA